MKTTLSSTLAVSVGFACALALTSTTAPADQVWEQRYTGPGNGNDAAYAVAVDSVGDVAVTGKSLNENGDFDFLTIKYSNAGNPIWTNRFDGPYHADDVATAVAVDKDHNVIVTGYLAVTNSPSDPGHISINTVFYTAKYGAANGALLWYHIGPDHGGLGDNPGGTTSGRRWTPAGTSSSPTAIRLGLTPPSTMRQTAIWSGSTDTAPLAVRLDLAWVITSRE